MNVASASHRANQKAGVVTAGAAAAAPATAATSSTYATRTRATDDDLSDMTGAESEFFEDADTVTLSLAFGYGSDDLDTDCEYDSTMNMEHPHGQDGRNDRICRDDDQVGHNNVNNNNNNRTIRKVSKHQQLPTSRELAKILSTLSSNEDNSHNTMVAATMGNGCGFNSTYTDDMMLTHQLATVRQIQAWNQVATIAHSINDDNEQDNDNNGIVRRNHKKNTRNKFLHDLVESDGIQRLLQFMEVHIKNPTVVGTTMSCLLDLLTTSSSSSSSNSAETDNDTRSDHDPASQHKHDDVNCEEKKETEESDEENNASSSNSNCNSNSKRLIEKTIEHEGIEIMLRAFEIHMNLLSHHPTSSSSSSSCSIGSTVPGHKTTTNKITSLWKSFSTSLSVAATATNTSSSSLMGRNNDLKCRSVGEHDYDYVSVGISDLDLSVDDTDQNGNGLDSEVGSLAVHDNNNSNNMHSKDSQNSKNTNICTNDTVDASQRAVEPVKDIVYTSYTATIKVAEGLSIILPNCQSNAQISSILHFFIVMVPKIVRYQKQKLQQPSSVVGSSKNRLEPKLMLGIISCFVVGTDVDGIEKVVNIKELLYATVQIMKLYPHDATINVGGCIILQELGPLLSMKDRRECGVISVLGELKQCMDMDMVDVKRVADTILNELN